jgi:hypothetical protein
MRRDDLSLVMDALKEPTRRFVREARVRTCLLVSSAGQVLAQHGFTRSYELVNVASLAASAHAAAGYLAGLTGERAWKHLHNHGAKQQLFLAPFRTPAEELILVAIFDAESSLGLVQLFFDRMVEEVRALPELRRPAQPGGPAGDPASFERDLEAGARRVFTPQPMGQG